MSKQVADGIRDSAGFWKQYAQFHVVQINMVLLIWL